MYNLRHLFFLVMLVASFMHVYAYPRSSNMHYFGVSAGGGYYQFFTNIQGVTTQGDAVGLLGLNYEYRGNSFWFQSGLEGQLQRNHSAFDISNPDYTFVINDTQGKSLYMHYLLSDFRETEQLVFLNIPLLVGYYHQNGFYIGAGMKFGWAVYADTKTDLRYKTYGIYEQYVDDFANMPNHFYTDYSLSRKAQTKALFKSAVVFEVGGDLLAHSYGTQSSSCYVLKIGAFAEMGLNSPYKKSENTELYIYPNADQAQILDPTCLYNVKTADSYSFIPFCAGIKLTMLFRVSTPRSRCNCY